MTKGKKEKQTDTKGISTERNKSSVDDDVTISDSDSIWKSPSKLKEEVQTIIDIMGPSLSPKFAYNTSSEADNEESVFSNSKFSSIKYKPRCDCNDYSEKSDAPHSLSKNETNISAAADQNSTTISATLEDITDPRTNFPYEENYCSNTQYICPPPQLPTKVCMNSECFCPQVASILHGRGMSPENMINSYRSGVPAAPYGISPNNDRMAPKDSKASKDPKNSMINWLKTIVSSSNRPVDTNCSCEYYKMDIKRKSGDDKSPPRRVVFELVQDVPRYNKNNEAVITTSKSYASKNQKNRNNEKLIDTADLQNVPCKDTTNNCEQECPTVWKKPIERTTYCDTGGKTRVDVYYFDHGSFNHYRTTDAPPLVTTEEVADKTEKHTTRFWAEIFGTIHIGMSFVTSFILQLFRFCLYSVCRPLTIGLIQLASDYLLKPLLATLFNGVAQPALIFCYNILASMRDLCDPISEGIGYFLRELAVLVRAFRIVEVKNETCKCQTDCKCEKKSKKHRITC